MKICYACCSTMEDYKNIESLGFDTVICQSANLPFLSFTNLKAIIMLPDNYISAQSIILSSTGNDRVIGYYLYDEPELRNISIEEQEKFITFCKQFTDKKLACCIIETWKKRVSDKFDWIMPDIYYSQKISIKGKFVKLCNYLDIIISSKVFQILYPNNVIIPTVGLYDDKDEFLFEGETQNNFNKDFINYLSDSNSFAVYTWNSSPPRYFGISTSDIYKGWARQYCFMNDLKLFGIKHKIFHKIVYYIVKGGLKVVPLFYKK